MSTTMVDRISLLLKAKNISASQFADEISVQRSSISHVLSGRNKPSLEFVQKILKRYPEINPDWLLFGKGPMNMEYNLFSDTNESLPFKEEAISMALSKQENLIRPVPEPEEIQVVIPPVKPEVSRIEEKSKGIEPIESLPRTESVKMPDPQPVTQEVPATAPKTAPQEKSIEKVLVFFNNKTFKEYSPE